MSDALLLCLASILVYPGQDSGSSSVPLAITSSSCLVKMFGDT